MTAYGFRLQPAATQRSHSMFEWADGWFMGQVVAQRQHAGATVTMQAWRRNQRGQTFDQYKRRQQQADTVAGPGLDDLEDEMIAVDLAQVSQSEVRPGTVAQKVFQDWPISASMRPPHSTSRASRGLATAIMELERASVPPAADRSGCRR